MNKKLSPVSILWHLVRPGGVLGVQTGERCSPEPKREGAAPLVSLLLLEQEEFPESQSASQAKRNKTVRSFSPWVVAPLRGFRWLRTGVPTLLITRQTPHRTEGAELAACQGRFMADTSLPPWGGSLKEAVHGLCPRGASRQLSIPCSE